MKTLIIHRLLNLKIPSLRLGFQILLSFAPYNSLFNCVNITNRAMIPFANVVVDT